MPCAYGITTTIERSIEGHSAYTGQPSIHPCMHPSAARVHAYIHTSYTPSTIQFLAAPKTSVVLFIYRHRVLPSSRARLIAKSRKNPLLAIFASLSLFESSRVEWSGVESFWVEGRKTPSAAATTTKQQKQQQQQTRRQTQDEAKKKLNVEIGHV